MRDDHDRWVLPAYIAGCVVAFVTVLLLPARARDDGVLMAWAVVPPMLGIATVGSIIGGGMLRAWGGAFTRTVVVALIVALWGVAAWARHDSRVQVTRTQVVVPAALPWAAPKVTPLEEIKSYELSCRRVAAARNSLVNQLRFVGQAGDRSISFSDGFEPSKPVPAWWVRDAEAVKKELAARGAVRTGGAEVVEPACVEERGSALAPAMKARFDALMASGPPK